MRIINGKYRGKSINAPKSLPIRPTTDFAKESLFNILNNRLIYEELEVCDLFCGSGNISFEFLSRGAKKVNSIDLNYKCVEFVRSTSKQLEFNNHKIVKYDVFKLLKSDSIGQSYNLVFADPPYDHKDLNKLPELVLNSSLLEETGLLIIEHPEEYSFDKIDGFVEHRKYGRVNFSFFEK